MGAVLNFPAARRETASAVESAKILKATLRRTFPATTFSVKLSRGTGYGSVHISWTDGPTQARVDQIAAPFAGSDFDGMTDSSFPTYATLPDGRRSGLRYVLSARHTSLAFAQKAAAQVAAFYGVTPPALKASGAFWELENDSARLDGEYWSTLIHRAQADHTRYSRTA